MGSADRTDGPLQSVHARAAASLTVNFDHHCARIGRHSSSGDRSLQEDVQTDAHKAGLTGTNSSAGNGIAGFSTIGFSTNRFAAVHGTAGKNGVWDPAVTELWEAIDES